MNLATKRHHSDDEDDFPPNKQPRSCESTNTDDELDDELDDEAKLARRKEVKQLLCDNYSYYTVWDSFTGMAYNDDPALVCYLVRKWRKGAYQHKNDVELCEHFGCSLASLPMDPVPLWDEESFGSDDEKEEEVKEEEEEEEEEIDWEGPEEPEEYDSGSDDNAWSDDDITPAQNHSL
ncbi:hypothetical protein BDA99DRAFT_566975 [Phascolomyces articulosus]|uniref:Uncharacterized protein n=1 Tax=Phascolomyces articulosus TaxID=60185 RepID=A0AAD5P843_9FUNG|nr:hypothetical protein BDA99DRAFT_566975 [Phascolomyces articulosus]